MQATYTQKIGDTDYTVYMSGNKYVAGTHTFVIGTYQGTEHELVPSMQQDIAGLQTLVGEQEQVNQEQTGNINSLQEDVHNLQEEGLNGPDNEDITLHEKKYRFADKLYDELNFSGKGRTYLRKNVKSITEISGNSSTTYVKNLLSQDMLLSPHTIYHIQYNYELGNTGYFSLTQSITINNIEFKYKDVTLKPQEKIILGENGKILTNESYQWAVSLNNYYVNNGYEDTTVRVAVLASVGSGVDYTTLYSRITIPEDCILKFEGGSISYGVLDAQGTIMECSVPRSEVLNVAIYGTYEFSGYSKNSILTGSTPPEDPEIGQMFFYLGGEGDIPIWYNGVFWVDATGTQVSFDNEEET